MTQLLLKDIRLPFTVPAEEAIETAKRKASGLLGGDIRSAHIFRRSIDARKREDIRFVYSVLLESGVSAARLNAAKLAKIGASVLEEETLPPAPTGSETLDGRPVIVGFGPCGMFCAMLLAEYGFRPIVLERGDDVDARAAAVERFAAEGILDPESNIQFGAGGAGTFSDGKLVTRINDGKCRYVLERFRDLGAPEEILLEAKPHIGTDLLRGVVKNAAAFITARGGEIHTRTAVRGIRYRNGRAAEVVTDAGTLPCPVLVLAIGHSARDTYYRLMADGLDIRPKPFSVGVRIEHRQSDIDEALFGRHAGDIRLGRGEYALSRREDGRSVYTFCMCPGGTVVAAASEEGGVVTNGMSAYHRDGVNANAAVAVSVQSAHPIEYQRTLERAAFAAGGGDYSAPIQTVGDFLSGGWGSAPTLVQPTYGCGRRVRPTDLRQVLPPDVCAMLELGLRDFGTKIRGFDAPFALLTGVETRTSAPVRILRTGASFTAPGVDNLYPCGEGAGYAGGITSAAVDGIAAALRIAERYKAKE